MEFQKLCHFADIYRFVLGFFERFHFTGGILYSDPRSKKAPDDWPTLKYVGHRSLDFVFLHSVTLKGSRPS